MLVHCSTQHPSEMQHLVAHALRPARRTTCRSSAGAWAAASAARSRSRRCSPASPRSRRSKLEPPGQAAPRPRRRLPDHRPAPLLPLRVRGRLRRRRPHPRRRADDGLARRLLGRPVGPGDDARDLPLRQRLLAARRRDPRLLAARPTRRATPPSAASAGRRARSRSRTSSTRSRATLGKDPLDVRRAQLLRHDRAQRHALRPDGRGQHHPRARRRARGDAATTARAAPRSPRSTRRARC